MRRSALPLLLVAFACATTTGIAQEPQAPAAANQPEEGQDVFYLTADRLIILRFAVAVDGKPIKQRWEEFLDEQFKSLDKDGDKKLTGDETRGVPTQQVLETLELVRASNPRGSLLIQRNPQAREFSRQEFGRHFERAGFSPFDVREQGAQPQPRGDDGQQAAMQKLLKGIDSNGDSLLSYDEMRGAMVALRKDDLDRDETISVEELTPTDMAFQQRFVLPSGASPGDRLGQAQRFLTAQSPRTWSEVVARLLQMYDGAAKEPKDQRLSRKEIGLPETSFAKPDLDKDGALGRDELYQLVQKPTPDIVATIRMGSRDKAQQWIELRKLTDLPVELAVDKGAAKLTFGSVQLEFTADVGLLDIPALLTKMHSAADRDNNGYLDQNEAGGLGSLASFFRTVDRDKNGMVFAEEFSAGLTPLATMVTKQTKLMITDRGLDFFRILDSNGDRRISVREFRALESKGKTWDRNGDGQVNRDEIPQQFQLSVSRGDMEGLSKRIDRGIFIGREMSQPTANVQTQGPGWFVKMDRNQDGDVSAREFLGSVETFKHLDRDQDGLIDSAEAAAPRPIERSETTRSQQ